MQTIPRFAQPSVIVSTAAEPVAPGKFEPSRQSLSHHEVPEWFRDRKFDARDAHPPASGSLAWTGR